MICLALALLVAAPFEDVHRRFSIELPEGWRFAPMPGELESVSFARRRDGVPAHAFVRVFDAQGSSAAELDELFATMYAKLPGYQSVARGAAELAGVVGRRHRFVIDVAGAKKLPKMVEERLVVYRGKAYLIHVETLADVFASFEHELERLFASFRFSGAPASQADTGGTLELVLLDSPLVGRWVMVADGVTELLLRADGTFALAEARGTFRIEGNKLLTRLPEGEEAFVWRIEGDELVLSSPALGGAIRYRRAESKK